MVTGAPPIAIVAGTNLDVGKGPYLACYVESAAAAD